jgi:hypothetical protein
MHGVVPRIILGRSWWDKTRREIYKSTDNHCLACGDAKMEVKGSNKWLEAHEMYSINYKRGRMKLIEVVPLCPYCHSYIHEGRLRSLLELGEIPHNKFAAIIQHGDAILQEAGLRRESYEVRDHELSLIKSARWEDWRLELNGKLYPPIYESYAHWMKAMGY